MDDQPRIAQDYHAAYERVRKALAGNPYVRDVLTKEAYDSVRRLRECFQTDLDTKYNNIPTWTNEDGVFLTHMIQSCNHFLAGEMSVVSFQQCIGTDLLEGDES